MRIATSILPIILSLILPTVCWSEFNCLDDCKHRAYAMSDQAAKYALEINESGSTNHLSELIALIQGMENLSADYKSGSDSTCLDAYNVTSKLAVMNCFMLAETYRNFSMNNEAIRWCKHIIKNYKGANYKIYVNKAKAMLKMLQPDSPRRGN